MPTRMPIADAERGCGGPMRIRMPASAIGVGIGVGNRHRRLHRHSASASVSLTSNSSCHKHVASTERAQRPKASERGDRLPHPGVKQQL